MKDANKMTPTLVLSQKPAKFQLNSWTTLQNFRKSSKGTAVWECTTKRFAASPKPAEKEITA
jgi:hypothetical protein